jgi:hypothetical protein
MLRYGPLILAVISQQALSMRFSRQIERDLKNQRNPRPAGILQESEKTRDEQNRR